MTLEEFLTEAGVGTEGIEAGNVGPQPPHWLQQYRQMETVHQKQQILDVEFQDDRLGISGPLMLDPVTPGRKRGSRESIGEKTVERRQKRMIKNRESAARSRARKQAYTNELENKVSRLEEENQRLKKQKELDTILHLVPPPELKYQLCRSSSAPPL